MNIHKITAIAADAAPFPVPVEQGAVPSVSVRVKLVSYSA
jgi:hypothetical protein